MYFTLVPPRPWVWSSLGPLVPTSSIGAVAVLRTSTGHLSFSDHLVLWGPEMIWRGELRGLGTAFLDTWLVAA